MDEQYSPLREPGGFPARGGAAIFGRDGVRALQAIVLVHLLAVVAFFATGIVRPRILGSLRDDGRHRATASVRLRRSHQFQDFAPAHARKEVRSLVRPLEEQHERDGRARSGENRRGAEETIPRRDEGEHCTDDTRCEKPRRGIDRLFRHDACDPVFGGHESQ